MLLAGLAAGMLGIGAGTFKVTVQENILKLPPKVSNTNALNIFTSHCEPEGRGNPFFPGIASSLRFSQ